MNINRLLIISLSAAMALLPTASAKPHPLESYKETIEELAKDLKVPLGKNEKLAIERQLMDTCLLGLIPAEILMKQHREQFKKKNVPWDTYLRTDLRLIAVYAGATDKCREARAPFIKWAVETRTKELKEERNSRKKINPIES